MIDIARIDHIAMAVADIDEQAPVFEGLFGFRRQGEREDETLDALRVRYEIPGESGLGWELLAPRSPEGLLQAFLDSPRGPGLHHVGIEVPDLDAASEALDRHGIAPANGADRLLVEDERGGEGFNFEFFAPQSAPDWGVGQRPVTAERERSLGIVGFDHVCHAYRDRDELAEWYERTFGMRQIWRTPDGEHADFADLVLEIPGQPLVWEIIMPVGDDSFIRRFLDQRGPAVHHVAFQVEDWDRAMTACDAADVRTIEFNEGTTDGARWCDTFIHPRETGGVLTQLFWEEQPGTWIRSDKVRPPGFAT